MAAPKLLKEPLIRSSRPSAVLAAGTIVCAGLGLGGCSVTRTAFGPLQYDKASPAAGAIANTSVQGVPYPSLVNVPSQPTDVRPVTAWNRNIFDTINARRRMEAFVVTYPQSLYGAEAYAQDGQALAAPALTEKEAKAMSDRSLAFAKDGQARATPPSPAP